ncbi:MAG: threonylcarbamoyl-AMP synthase [Clostridia bacterium]|nr:threonylcarbamoyl-AMP synthase [Clostridia bacterium]
MKTLKIVYGAREDLIPAASILRAGGLVAFPTETVYGLGGDALDSTAAARIYAAKGRPSDNPLIVHLADPSDAEIYCYTGEMFYRISEKFMPGPITVIMPKKDIIPDTVTGGLRTVGIRVPSHRAAHDLIELFGGPVAAPSANISGRPSPTSFSHVVNDLDGKIDCIIDGGDCLHGVESTIVMADRDGKSLKLLRPGAVTIEMLSAVCDDIEIDPAVLSRFSGVPLAPGMKYRHYAPSEPLTVVDADRDSFIEFVNREPDCGVICFDEDFPLIISEFRISMGGEHHSDEQARNIFTCLRYFDSPEVRGRVKHIYARMPDKNGVGFAVFNRLIKAAGFSTLKI